MPNADPVDELTVSSSPAVEPSKLHAHSNACNKHEHNLTLHDPTSEQLKWLATAYPECRVFRLEVALDFRLRDRSNDFRRFEALSSKLSRQLAPKAGHFVDGNVMCKHHSPETGRYETARPGANTHTAIFHDRSRRTQWRIYTKTKDAGVGLDEYFTRLEITLDRGALQRLGVCTLADLPNLFTRLRGELAPLFRMASTITSKPQRDGRRAIRTRSADPVKQHTAHTRNGREVARLAKLFNNNGAVWALSKGYGLTADACLNAAIGDALRKLERQLAPKTSGKTTNPTPSTAAPITDAECCNKEHFSHSAGAVTDVPEHASIDAPVSLSNTQRLLANSEMVHGCFNESVCPVHTPETIDPKSQSP